MREIKFRAWDRKKKQFDTCRNGGDNLGFGLDYKGEYTAYLMSYLKFIKDSEG